MNPHVASKLCNSPKVSASLHRFACVLFLSTPYLLLESLHIIFVSCSARTRCQRPTREDLDAWINLHRQIPTAVALSVRVAMRLTHLHHPGVRSVAQSQSAAAPNPQVSLAITNLRYVALDALLAWGFNCDPAPCMPTSFSSCVTKLRPRHMQAHCYLHVCIQFTSLAGSCVFNRHMIVPWDVMSNTGWYACAPGAECEDYCHVNISATCTCTCHIRLTRVSYCMLRSLFCACRLATFPSEAHIPSSALRSLS